MTKVTYTTNENGTVMYYLNDLQTTAVDAYSLSIMFGCSTLIIQDYLAVLGIGEIIDIETTQGNKSILVVLEKDISELINALLESDQVDKETILAMQSNYVQAGFGLQILLNVAPGVVAKEAINWMHRIGESSTVREYAEARENYLRSEDALKEEIRMNNLCADTVNGHNNKAVSLSWSDKRESMTLIQKSTMTTIHLHQAKALNKARKSNKVYSAAEKYDICRTICILVDSLDTFTNTIG